MKRSKEKKKIYRAVIVFKDKLRVVDVYEINLNAARKKIIEEYKINKKFIKQLVKWDKYCWDYNEEIFEKGIILYEKV